MSDAAISRRDQVRNVALYAILLWLMYLTAPAIYVGLTQATLCKALGASNTLANLPTTAYFWAVLIPVVVAIRFHKSSMTCPVLATACAGMAAAGALVAAVLWWPAPAWLRIATVIFYGGVIGAGLGLRNVFIWEVVNRGIPPELRGWAYGLAYGVGPIFAVIGSLLGQLILSGEVAIPVPSLTGKINLVSFTIDVWEFPLKFVLFFGATVPLLLLAAVVATQFKLPPTISTSESTPPPFSIARMISEIMRDRILLLAIIAYVFVDSGFTIIANMSLYTREVLDRPPEDYAGYQNALRFAGKMSVGVVLGWLVVRTSPKTGMLLTGLFCLTGIMGALFGAGKWFLLSFAALGGGELYGVYYPNYMMIRSHPNRLRANMAMLQLLSLATSLAPAAFGAISDWYGLRASFVAAACVVCGSLGIIIFGLPARPSPQQE